jgi:hypothetical protein
MITLCSVGRDLSYGLDVLGVLGEINVPSAHILLEVLKTFAALVKILG